MYVSSPIPHKKARIEIIPLIDIMFFLLASFMMVSLSQVHMKGIKVNLPRGSSGETQTKREYISVSVDKNGTYFFDKDEVNEQELQARLMKVHQSSPEAKVFVRGDRDTAHLNVAHLLDYLRSAGYYKISFEITSEALKGVPGGPRG
ncbi:MAG: biopolymer transporter ExbD [Verrucomicrobia bacterium]|nr:MAG: biopolymer transporter ExbD [Verrucomicrobiota bacterium]